jgi:hypothetical protein
LLHRECDTPRLGASSVVKRARKVHVGGEIKKIQVAPICR